MTKPKPPAGIGSAHAERRAKRDREVAESFAAQSPIGPEVTYPAQPPVPLRAPEAVRKVVTYTSSGARLETFVGEEPRTDVEFVQPGRRDRETERERILDANARHNRRASHLLGG